jgi:hypothetical protein
MVLFQIEEKMRGNPFYDTPYDSRKIDPYTWIITIGFLLEYAIMCYLAYKYPGSARTNSNQQGALVVFGLFFILPMICIGWFSLRNLFEQRKRRNRSE